MARARQAWRGCSGHDVALAELCSRVVVARARIRGTWAEEAMSDLRRKRIVALARASRDQHLATIVAVRAERHRELRGGIHCRWLLVAVSDLLFFVRKVAPEVTTSTSQYRLVEARAFVSSVRA